MKMSTYIHGNLAMEEQHERQEHVRPRHRQAAFKRSIPAGEKMFYLFVIVLCVVVAGSVIWKYAQMYEVNTRLQHIEQEIQQLEKENESLKLEVRKLRDPKRLIDMSKSLGFQPLDERMVSEIGGAEKQSLPASGLAYAD